MNSKVIVIGSMNYDIILKGKRLPEKGETLPADGCTFSSGGKGANQAVQSAKLGLCTYMVGCLGDDPMGDSVYESVAQYGVQTDYIRRVPGPTGLAIIHSMEDGSLHSVIVQGANVEISRENIDAAAGLMDENTIVLLQMEIPQDINRYAINLAKSHGCRVLLNAAPAREIEAEYLEKCDILVVNEVEASFYSGRIPGSPGEGCAMAAELAAKYHNTVIITLGSEGAAVSDGNRSIAIPPEKVRAIETTGAGDSFIGGTVYALLNGKDIFEACRFATKCSAVTVTRLGAQIAMPVLAEVTE